MPATMKEARTLERRRIEIREVKGPPAPGPREALIRVGSVGLCGSDLHVYVGDDPYAHYPIRQGHEFSGWIEELGPECEAVPPPGALVAVQPLLPCGDCIACRRARPNCCVRLRVLGAHVDGALAEWILVPYENVHLADGLTPEEAAFVEPVSIGLQMIQRSGIEPGQVAVVLGVGPIGQSVLLAGQQHGVRFIAVDRVAARLHLAEEIGVEATIDASREDVSHRVTELTHGDGPLIVFEATGVAQVIEQAVDLVAHSGTVVVAGTPNGNVSLSAIDLVRKEIDLRGSRNNAGTFSRAVEVVRRSRAQVRGLITHRYELDRVADAIEFAIRSPSTANKVIITVGTAPAAFE